MKNSKSECVLGGGDNQWRINERFFLTMVKSVGLNARVQLF